MAFDAPINPASAAAVEPQTTAMFNDVYDGPKSFRPVTSTAEQAREGDNTRQQIDKELEHFRNLADQTAKSQDMSAPENMPDLKHSLFGDNDKDKTDADVLAKLQDQQTKRFVYCHGDVCTPYSRK